jgi:cyclohexanone monooxygenase
MALMSEIADYQKMNEIRDRVSSLVSDPATAEALKPWYGQWCKRPTFNDEYLPTFNRPNVKLVDTKGKGIERVTENAVVVDGVEYEVDCLIFATGFEVGTAYTRRAEFEVYGRGGLPLSDYWAKGMKTHYGFLSHGFPNCFHMGLTQTGLAPNFTYMLGGQATHIAHVITEVKAREAKSVEPTPEAEAEWVKRVTGPTFMSAYQDVCTPGYYNGEGKHDGQGFLEASDPDGAVRFYEMLARWREQGDLEGLIVE